MCTWKYCEKNAVHPQVASDGEVWANLCDEHHAELEAAIGDRPEKMISAWVLAMGGAKLASRRVLKEWRK